MKSARELRDELHGLRDELDSIMSITKSEDRDLSPDEAARVDEILDLTPKLTQQFETQQKIEHDRLLRNTSRIESALNDLTREVGSNIGRTAGNWKRDSHGRGYRVLSKGERLNSSKLESDQYDAAHYILAKCFGSQRHTPEHVKAAMKEGDNGLGGFLVPNPLMDGFHDLARADSVLVQAGITQIQMDSESLSVPCLLQDGTVHAVPENTTIADSNMLFGLKTLSTTKLAMLVKLSRELYEDATELAARQLQLAMAAKMAERIDYYGLAGSGSAEPLGILNNSEIEDTGSIGAIAWEDLAAGILEIREANRRPNAIIMSPLIAHDLSLLTTGDGTNSAKGWLSSPETVRDKTQLVTSNCPDDKLIIGEWQHYAMGVRNQISVEATTTGGNSFADHQIWLKVYARVAFVPLDVTAFHALTGITS